MISKRSNKLIKNSNKDNIHIQYKETKKNGEQWILGNAKSYRCSDEINKKFLDHLSSINVINMEARPRCITKQWEKITLVNIENRSVEQKQIEIARNMTILTIIEPMIGQRIHCSRGFGQQSRRSGSGGRRPRGRSELVLRYNKWCYQHVLLKSSSFKMECMASNNF
jgi:hypothetical protein